MTKPVTFSVGLKLADLAVERLRGKAAQDAVYLFPVAVHVSAAVWNGLIIPHAKVRSFFQSERLRVWQLFEAMEKAVDARRDNRAPQEILFDWTLRLERVPRWTTVQLRAVLESAPDRQGVRLTVMFPDER